MKPLILSRCLYLFISVLLLLFSSCQDIIEPSISKSNVQLQAPSDQYQSTSYTVNFWWDEVDHALSYHLQVVAPSFDTPGSLVLDTIVKKNTFSFNLNPGNYQWRVMAENGSSQTPFGGPRSFNVAATSIKQQSVQLISPVNNLLTNQSSVILKWSSLYGATKYHLQIDTNNFVDENNVVSDQLIPTQQANFNFPKSQHYQWRVKAENDTAQAQWSAVYLINFDNIPPGQVFSVSPTDAATVSLPIALQWDAVAGVAKYKLYVYKSDGVTLYNQNFPMLINSTTYSFNQGNSGDKFYWVVTAVDAAGNESAADSMRSFSLQ